MASKPFAVWVVSGSLIFVGLAILGFAAPFLLTGGGFVIFLLVFSLIPLLAGVVTLTGKRAAFALAVGVSLFFLVLFSLFATFILSSPANPFFWVAVSILPALLVAAVFAILALKNAKAGLAGKKYLASRDSSGGLLTTAVIGFIVGALLVGTIGAGEITRILESGGQGVDIRIVRDASGNVAEPFTPKTFTVARGSEVDWFNGDGIVHTVRSDDGLFDSGAIDPGVRWDHAFTEPGTYEYHCEPHPWMTGTVVVT